MFRRSLVIIVVLISPVLGSERIELNGEVRVELPSDWSIEGDNSNYPYKIISREAGAEILIFRNILTSEEVIRNEEELKLSVDNVVADIILELPDAQLLSTTGYFEDERVRFELEFVSRDTTADVQLWHRFVGLIYAHPEGHQLLFTVWGKCLIEDAEIIRSDLNGIQNSLIYFGPVESSVFTPRDINQNWIYIGALVILLMILLILRKRQVRLGTVSFSKSSLFWRCDCGRLNHNTLENCRRCGQPRRQEPVT